MASFLNVARPPQGKQGAMQQKNADGTLRKVSFNLNWPSLQVQREHAQYTATRTHSHNTNSRSLHFVNLASHELHSFAGDESGR